MPTHKHKDGAHSTVDEAFPLRNFNCLKCGESISLKCLCVLVREVGTVKNVPFISSCLCSNGGGGASSSVAGGASASAAAAAAAAAKDNNPFDEEEWDEDHPEQHVINDALVDNGEPGVKVRALYDYAAAEEDELDLKTGIVLQHFTTHKVAFVNLALSRLQATSSRSSRTRTSRAGARAGRTVASGSTRPTT